MKRAFLDHSAEKIEKALAFSRALWYYSKVRYCANASHFSITQKGLNQVNTQTTIFAILQLLASIFLISVILLQSGKSAGLSGAISGGADTFMSKGKAKTLDAKLAKMTKWVALGFVVLTLVLNLL